MHFPPPEDFARVHRAKSESEALLVQRILQDAGIPALVQSRQVPGYSEVIRGAIGVWGDILVPKQYEDDALAYVQDYLRVMKSPTAGVPHPGRTLKPAIVFFDYGGTLAYVDPPIERIWPRLLKELGQNPAPASLAQAIQGANEVAGALNIYDYHGRMREYWLRYDQIVLARLGISDPGGRLAEAINAGFDRRDWYHLYPDVRETLDALRSGGFRLGIISNNVDDMLTRLDQLEVAPYFETVVYSQEARADKPDPAIFLLALDRARCQPEEAMHVGDSYEADVVGARNVGMTPVLIDRESRHQDEDCLRVTDLRQMLELVEFVH